MLAWIDLETTGISEHTHHILEVACVITDDELVTVAECTKLAIPCGDVVLGNPNNMVPLEHPHDLRANAIYAEHFNNGLVEELKREYGTPGWEDRSTPLAVGQAIQDFIDLHCPGPEQPPLCGSSVHFDRKFLAKHMPWVLNALHYRNVDVSSIRELAKRWRPEMEMPKKVGKHRALDDIYESIRLLRFFREEGFIG